MAAKKIMIRIRLKAYDHKILDDSAKLIVGQKFPCFTPKISSSSFLDSVQTS